MIKLSIFGVIRFSLFEAIVSSDVQEEPFRICFQNFAIFRKLFALHLHTFSY